jgi:hypothetical protein
VVGGGAISEQRMRGLGRRKAQDRDHIGLIALCDEHSGFKGQQGRVGGVYHAEKAAGQRV